MPIHHRIAFGVSVLLVVLSLSSGRPVFAQESTITISQGVDADTLNPLATNVTPTENVQLQMFDTLVRFDRGGKLIPWLASSFAQTKPNVWEFSLRHGVTFWNGDPLTSTDVAFTIAKIKDPKFTSQLTPRVATISEVRTPDPYTVDIITSKPVPLMPGYLWLTMIVDAKYWMEHGDDYMAEHPMGSGPYIFRRWVKNQEIDLDANPHFWGGKPAIDHVVLKPIADSKVRVAALRSGESNLITNVPAEKISTIASLKTLKVQSVKSTRILFFAFNTVKPGPQRNVLVRRAINYLVNVPSLLQSVLGGHGYFMISPIPENFVGYDPTVQGYHYDPRYAMKLLRQAGYPGGKGLSLIINAPRGRYNKGEEMANALADQLRAEGIGAAVKIQDWKPYYAQLGRRELAPLYEMGWANSSFDADGTLGNLFTTTSRISAVGTPKLDKLIEDARFELDPAKRSEKYSIILHIIQDQAPWIFLFQYQDLYAMDKDIQWKVRADELLYVDEMRVVK